MWFAKKTTTNNCDQVTQQIGLTVTDGAEGANAFAGAKGTMVFSDSFAQALRDGSIDAGTGVEWVQNAITSGKYSAMPEVVADGYMVAFTGDVMFPYEVVLKEDDPGITDITSITEDRVKKRINFLMNPRAIRIIQMKMNWVSMKKIVNCNLN